MRVTRRPRKLVQWVIAIGFLVLAGLWVAVQAVSRAPILRRDLIETLNERLDADVELGAFEVQTFPRMRIHGDGLKLRLHGQTNPTPFIEARHFEVSGGLWGMLRRHRRFRYVQVDGLRITIPPRSPHDRKAGNEAASMMTGTAIIERLEAKDAQLVILPRNPAKQPKTFIIHTLDLDSVGFDRPIPFTAALTNAIPTGEIAAQGTFGPWVKGDPALTPVRGRYSFGHADLTTIRGLSGTLTSSGDFTGLISEIDVRGTTTTPDFSIDGIGSPVPLETSFHVVVDGTNGDTYLRHVAATLGSTPISASGAIVSNEKVKGRTVKLDVTIVNGRVQDFLKLAVATPKPVMRGTLTMNAALLLPPGNETVADRMSLGGRFTLGRASFTDAGVQQQLAHLSRRAQGTKKADEPAGPIASDMAGQFLLRDGVVRFQTLRFDLPGANVDLAGRYTLRDARLNFRGTLGMDASLSNAAGGGLKRVLLKPLDPLFRRRGRGTLLPITIKGSRAQPKFGLDWGKVFK